MNQYHRPAHISAEFRVALERELEHLRQDVQPDICERLKLAREGGDVTDNGVYEHAKEELARLMVRCAEIETVLRDALVISHAANARPKAVEVGTIVRVARDDGKQCEYKIVESMEASPADGKVSDESPLGRALLGRKPGDAVSVQAPARTIAYTITDIQFIH